MSDLSARLARLSPEQRRRVVDELKTRRQHQEIAAPIQRRAAPTGDYQLSFAQERLWFLDQLSPGNAFYNISSAQRIPFAIKHSVLKRALSALVVRHGALRTIFPIVDGDPVQRVLRAEPAECALIDLSSVPIPAREAELQRVVAEAAQRPFDLATGPLFRATLLGLGPFESAFIFIIHHIVADSTSMDILFRELGTLYADEAAGRRSSLTDSPLQYTDFSVWQRDWLKGERLASELRYWQRQLTDLETLNLPTDRPRSSIQVHRGASVDLRISSSLRSSLYATARQSSATPFMLFLTAFYVLLYRYSQQDDLTVGVPIANRVRPELENVVGFFANSLVMRVDLSGNPTFRTALSKVREVALDAYDHQDVPFSAIVASLRLPQDLSRNPLFQVSFQLVTRDRNSSTSTGSAAVVIDRGTSIFDLTLNLWEEGAEIHGQLEYDSDLFERESMVRAARHYLTLLEAVRATPDLPIGELPMLAAEEHQSLLVAWNGTAKEYPARLLHELVEEQASRTPEAVALQKDDSSLSYAELIARASSVAQQLSRLDTGPRHAVGVMLPPSFDMVTAVLAVLKSGNAYVPLDPATPAKRLQRMLDAADVAFVITTSELSSRIPADCGVVLLDAETIANVDQEITPANGPVGPSDLAYIIFTSGSTGTPKGVMVPHRAVVNYLTWCRAAYPVAEGIGAPLCSPLWSDMSITSLFLPLICGRSVVLLDQDDLVESLDSALRSNVHFSFVKLTPSHLEALRSLSLGRPVPRNVAAFIVGGEQLLTETLALWRDQAPDLMIFNEYGPTETTVGCVVHFSRAGELGHGPVPIGTAIANTRLYVLDRHGQLVPAGVPGELYIGGAGVALGYVGETDLNSDRFLSDPFAPELGKIYRTGDLVRYRSDGVLEFIGRVDSQVKIRGFRIEPGDIEVAIRLHPAVKEVVVSMRDLGTLDKRLNAYIVLSQFEDDRGTLSQQLREIVQRELPAYMMPSAFIVVDAIPLTAAGKADLRSLERNSRAEQTRRGPAIAPATALERVIANIVEHVLGVASISTHDDFFADLGAHSLLVTKIVARLRDLLRIELPLRWIFEAPTVKELASAIARDPRQGTAAERTAGIVVAVMEMSDEQVKRELSSTGGLSCA